MPLVRLPERTADFHSKIWRPAADGGYPRATGSSRFAKNGDQPRSASSGKVVQSPLIIGLA